MDDVAALTNQFEYLFMRRIIVGLEDGTMSIVNAKQYANEFLAIEPFASMEDAYNKSLLFVTKHTEFVELKEYLDVFEKEKDVPGKINKMREHMKQNNIEAALQVAKE